MRTLSQRYNARFFYRHGGYSWNKDETPEQGHRRCAREKAKAWRWGRINLNYSWDRDWHADRSGISHDAPLWRCLAYSADTGFLARSLHCIDLGEDGHPDSDPYARVVEAELALEAMP